MSASGVRTQQDAVKDFPREPVVAWGGALLFESIFPVLATDDQARQMKLFPFGVFTYAPFSVAAVDELNGRGFIERIRSGDGVLMIATDEQVEMLRVWCGERFAGELGRTVIQNAPRIRIDRLLCRR
jgi:hypothetical protein